MSGTTLESCTTGWKGATFGGLVSVVLASIVYYSVPSLAATTPSWLFIGFFTLIVAPVIRFIAFYENLIELTILRDRGKISAKLYKEIVEAMTRQRFLHCSYEHQFQNWYATSTQNTKEHPALDA